MSKTENSHHSVPHEAVLLSQVIREQRTIRFTFTDSEVLIEKVRWHTPEWIGLQDRKVVNKNAIKFWEPLD